jgi:hypothetical protein
MLAMFGIGVGSIVWMAVYALLFYIVRYLLRITISRPREPLE